PVAAHAHVVIISDFYFAPEDIAPFCLSLAQRRVHGILVQVCDPAERDLSYAGRLRFEDPENPGHAPVTLQSVEAVREAYMQKFAAHQDALSEMARRQGWHFLSCTTDTPPENILARLYTQLEERR